MFAAEFEPEASTDTWSYTNVGRVAKFGITHFTAGLRLPAGAAVQVVELEGCDSDSRTHVQVVLLSQPSPSGVPKQETPFISTGDSETPGCAFFAGTPELSCD
jgi:hypothetical protein